MSNPFEYDLTNELRKPLTKYEALQLAVAVTPLMDAFGAKRNQMMYDPETLERAQCEEYFIGDNRSSDEIYLNLLFNLAEQILEKDAAGINQLLQSDKQFAYDEIMIERQQA